MLKSNTITCSINRPPTAVYEFASNPENLPQWVQSFCLSVRKLKDDWEMETTSGWVGFRFVPSGKPGVLDHIVTLPNGQSILNPLRVVSSGEGCEVRFTLFQRPEVSDEQFASDAEMVKSDLGNLKTAMENRHT